MGSERIRTEPRAATNGHGRYEPEGWEDLAGEPGRDPGRGGPEAPGGALHIAPIEEVEVPERVPPIAGRIHPAPGSLTLLYGAPGAGKGLVSLGWAERVIRGGGSVLVVDYETNPEEWVWRSRDIGLPEGLLYLDPQGIPIDKLGEALVGAVEQLEPTAVVLDSVLMSLGTLGEGEWSPQHPLAFAHALERMPCPIVGLAHEGRQGAVFGSRYWLALARMAWRLVDGEEGRKLTLEKNAGGARGESWAVYVHHHEGQLVSVQEREWSTPEEEG